MNSSENTLKYILVIISMLDFAVSVIYFLNYLIIFGLFEIISKIIME